MEKITYKTIKNNTLFEIDKIKGSRFIGRLFIIESKEEAEKELNDLKKRIHDARHHCYAYKIGIGENAITRFSDDGEPSGTAGKPLMTIINSLDVTNVMIVVTRYFGGIKLGTGGLIRAYTETAKAIFDKIEIIDIEINDFLEFLYNYDMTNLVMSILNKFSASIIKEQFDDCARVVVSINKGYTQIFIDELYERSNGQIKVIINTKKENETK